MGSEALLSDEYFFGDRLNTGSKLKFLSTWIYQDALDWHILTTDVCPDFHSDSTKNLSSSQLLAVCQSQLAPASQEVFGPSRIPPLPHTGGECVLTEWGVTQVLNWDVS